MHATADIRRDGTTWRGLLILGQVSSLGNLMTPEFTTTYTAAARDHKDLLAGLYRRDHWIQKIRILFSTLPRQSPRILGLH